MRETFQKGHDRYGVVQFFKDRKLVRLEYESPQELQGEIRHVKDDKIVRIEFANLRTPRRDLQLLT